MSARCLRASRLGLPFGLILCAASASPAQSAPSSDWHNLQALPSQTRLRITASGQTKTCFLDSISDDRIACSSGASRAGAHHEFARDQVTLVRLTGHFSSAAAVITTAAFTAAGAGIGATQGKGISSQAKPVGVGAAGGLGIGIVAGILVGRAVGGSHGSIVYRHP